MTQKIFLLKNKAIIIALFIIIAISLVLIGVNQKYNHDFFIKKIEENLGLHVNKKGEFSINFFPKMGSIGTPRFSLLWIMSYIGNAAKLN